MTYQEWYLRLNKPVPLKLVPQLLGITADELAKAVLDNELKVFKFTAADGRVFRMVRREDIEAYKKNPLTHPHLPGVMSQDVMQRAIKKMIAGDTPRKRRRPIRLPWIGTPHAAGNGGSADPAPGDKTRRGGKVEAIKKNRAA